VNSVIRSQNRANTDADFGQLALPQFFARTADNQIPADTVQIVIGKEKLAPVADGTPTRKPYSIGIRVMHPELKGEQYNPVGAVGVAEAPISAEPGSALDSVRETLKSENMTELKVEPGVVDTFRRGPALIAMARFAELGQPSGQPLHFQVVDNNREAHVLYENGRLQVYSAAGDPFEVAEVINYFATDNVLRRIGEMNLSIPVADTQVRNYNTIRIEKTAAKEVLVSALPINSNPVVQGIDKKIEAGAVI
jgi:hypothetical protein